MTQSTGNGKTGTPAQEANKIIEQTAGFTEAIDQMLEGTQQLNKTFGQARQRATEIMKEVSDAALRIVRLGGDMKDVYETMNDVARATGKNVVINADVAGKIFATSKVLGQDVEKLVNSFADVGIQFSKIDDMMADSTKYVRDMGLNTKEVMDKVITNFDKLNRFNFEGGVQGMTKMAAKAAMFRIDMGETFSLAEDVMKPERAVEVASAFQRLGVAAGNLVDPFALMNASINDPGALQDAIVNIGKEFTYFDEKTKSFKINPQGMLTLRELSKETGVSYETLTKAGLAASELDKRLSQISPSLTFKDESDKQFLSNLSQMNDKGEYEVKISDTETKKLSEVTQEEFDNLIKQQKEAPKDMEEIARRQLGGIELMRADLRAIAETVTRGFASTEAIRKGAEGARNISDKVLGTVSKKFIESDVITKNADVVAKQIKDQLIEYSNGGKVDKEELEKNLKSSFGTFAKEGADLIADVTKRVGEELKISGKITDSSAIKFAVDKATKELGSVLGGVDVNELLTKAKSTANTVKGNITSTSESALSGGLSDKVADAKKGAQSLIDKVSQSLNVDGTITIKIDAPPGVTTQQLQEYVNNDDLKRSFWNFVQKQMVDSGMQKNKTLGK
jgi:hypothetical protein